MSFEFLLNTRRTKISSMLAKIPSDGGSAVLVTLSMAKLPMKKRLPRVNVRANLDGFIKMVGRPITNASTKKKTESSNATTKPLLSHDAVEKNKTNEKQGEGPRRWTVDGGGGTSNRTKG